MLVVVAAADLTSRTSLVVLDKGGWVGWKFRQIVSNADSRCTELTNEVKLYPAVSRRLSQGRKAYANGGGSAECLSGRAR